MRQGGPTPSPQSSHGSSLSSVIGDRVDRCARRLCAGRRRGRAERGRRPRPHVLPHLRPEGPGPSLRPGQVVAANNLSVHHDPEARRLSEERDFLLIHLPAYSPDFAPIEPPSRRSRPTSTRSPRGSRPSSTTRSPRREPASHQRMPAASSSTAAFPCLLNDSAPRSEGRWPSGSVGAGWRRGRADSRRRQTP